MKTKSSMLQFYKSLLTKSCRLSFWGNSSCLSSTKLTKNQITKIAKEDNQVEEVFPDKTFPKAESKKRGFGKRKKIDDGA